MWTNCNQSPKYNLFNTSPPFMYGSHDFKRRLKKFKGKNKFLTILNENEAIWLQTGKNESKVPYSRSIDGLIERSVVCMLTCQHAAFIVNMPACLPATFFAAVCQLSTPSLLLTNSTLHLHSCTLLSVFIPCIEGNSTLLRNCINNASCSSQLGMIVYWNGL